MTLENCPLLGTPKQNAFICTLATKLGFDSLQAAVNTALARALNAVLSDPFSCTDASTVIAYLLALANTRGLTIWTGKRKGGKRGGKKGAASASAASRQRSIAASGSDQDKAQTLAGFSPQTLAEELERRGYPAGLALSNPDLTGGAAALLAAAVRVVLVGVREQKGACLPLELADALADLRGAIADTGADVPAE